MAIKGVDTKCYILALFVRDDGERFLLGSGHYEFKDTQMHFAANAIQNDIVEVQGNDGFLLAGQVRRPGTQSFDGYVGDGTMSKEETESYRRQFFSFFRKNFFYKVIYVFSDGTAIQRKSGFLVDDPTVEELYQMYPEYHVALNFEDVNYYSYSEDEEGQEQYAKEATIDTSSMWATGGLVWDEYGAVNQGYAWGGEMTASGTEFTVQNDLSLPAPITEARLNGDTYQQNYSGKNLLYIPDGTFTNNGITWTKNNNTLIGSGTGTGTWSATSDWQNVTLPVGTYTFSIGNSTTKRIQFARRVDSSSSAQTVIIPIGSTSITFTNNTETHQYRVVVLDTSGQVFTNFSVDNVQLEAGSTATAYEPYVGGTPAPNPDYPQEIQTVTGEQTVSVTGKNLWDPDNVLDGVGLDAPTGQTYPATIRSTLDYTSIKPDTTYTLSGCSMKAICFYDSNKMFISRSSQYTVTSPSGTSYVRIAFDNTVEHSNIQLESGSTATAYEAYQSQSYTVNLGSTELCKLGDYQDYIYKGTDGWYVHKAIGKITYTGDSSENWQYLGTSSGPFRISIPNSNYHIDNNTLPLLYTNYYTPIKWTEITSTPYAVTAFSNTVLPFRNTDITSLNDWKTWLSSHNTTVYYPFATPTDTKITDNTLVSQLDALGSAKLMVGENNVLVSATGTNLPAELQIKYYSTVSFDGAGFVWEEGGSGGATVVEVDSITNTYPIWRVKGPAVNPQLSVINTNTTLRYTGTVTSTQTLEIDMFNKTAKLNGVSVIGNVSGDWVSLAPGTNRVIYTAENADAQPSTIEWQEVVG